MEILFLCLYVLFVVDFLGMMTLLFMQSAFYNENAEENETICGSVK